MRALVMRGAIAAALVVASACAGGSGRDLEWWGLAEAPTPRTEVAAALTDGGIVVAGGFASPDRTVATVEIYDPATDSWAAGPDLPVAVNHAMAAPVNGEVSVFGGYPGTEFAGDQASDRAFVLSDGRWQELPRMPEPRAAGGAVAVGGRVYVIGGVGPAGLADRTLVYDPASRSWSEAPGLGVPREHLGVAAQDGLAYAVGGRTAELGNLGTAEAFDPRAGAWTPLPDLPTARGGMAAAGTSNGLVIGVGGEESAGTFDDAEAYDVRGERWIVLPPMPTARHGLGAVADGTVLYALLGGVDPGFSFSGATEAIDLEGLV